MPLTRDEARARVVGLYQELLGRAPGAGDAVEAWTDAYLSQGEAAVRTGFIGSQEYSTRKARLAMQSPVESFLSGNGKWFLLGGLGLAALVYFGGDEKRGRRRASGGL